MPNIPPGELELLIKECLTSFYKRRIAGLKKLGLKRLLRKKNPYLFRALGIQTASEMVERLLAAHITSSDETLFGKFFEPICEKVCGGRAAGVKGIDFVIETAISYEAIALKSGTNIFNSDATSKQAERFKEHERSLRATGFSKRFIATMGCAYGRSSKPQPTAGREFYKLAGQAFWEKLTASPDFYFELVRLMREEPERHSTEFADAWNDTVARFESEFKRDFCDASGKILWNRLVSFNSGQNID